MIVPRKGRVTGEIDIHEISMDNSGQLGGTSDVPAKGPDDSFDSRGHLIRQHSFDARTLCEAYQMLLGHRW
jgi:hypothetical protein